MSSVASAAPVTSPWPIDGPDDTVAVAAAPLAGFYAAADSFEDSVEIRDINQQLVATITRSQIQALLPWMTLSGGPDGPSGLTFSDSGRSLFILVHSDALPSDGLGSDAVLRYDISTATLSTFARVELFDQANQFPHLAAAHFKGRLFVGTFSAGIKIYSAAAAASTGTLSNTKPLPDAGPVHGLAVDREGNFLFAASGSNIYRASASTSNPSFTLVGAIPNIRAIAYTDHYGGTSNPGLYILSADASSSTISFIPIAQARGTATFAPTTYLTTSDQLHDLAMTADGKLLSAADEDALLIADTTDTRLTYQAWLHDEFNQLITFAKGLISPDGELPGWVIDGDVQQGWTRFHPATPDGACWVVLALLMSDHVNADPAANNLVRQILTRYAGLAADGIGPSISPDGYLRHWIDPTNGGVKPGWDPEFAVYSTMKMVVAADRAMAYYPGDAAIRQARNKIISQVTNWDSYIKPTDELYLISLPGGASGTGPNLSVTNAPFTEGILFVEQAATYGGTSSFNSFARWIDRSRWPVASTIPGKTVTSDSIGHFHPNFINLYPLLLQQPYRNSAAWRLNVRNALESSAGWTDDNGPKYFTVFSAGTTRSDWGGYHADSLSDHPGNLTTFPSLLAFCGAPAGAAPGGNPSAAAVSAYHAYRKGARQTFLSGASILYRRSDVDKTYQPNSAGLPDVILGALGLAELLSPGAIDAHLALVYPPLNCPTDIYPDGVIDTTDLILLLGVFGQTVTPGAPGDINSDGLVNTADLTQLLSRFGQYCP